MRLSGVRLNFTRLEHARATPLRANAAPSGRSSVRRVVFDPRPSRRAVYYDLREPWFRGSSGDGPRCGLRGPLSAARLAVAWGAVRPRRLSTLPSEDERSATRAAMAARGIHPHLYTTAQPESCRRCEWGESPRNPKLGTTYASSSDVSTSKGTPPVPPVSPPTATPPAFPPPPSSTLCPSPSAAPPAWVRSRTCFAQCGGRVRSFRKGRVATSALGRVTFVIARASPDAESAALRSGGPTS
jgi:hypothetical protein